MVSVAIASPAAASPAAPASPAAGPVRLSLHEWSCLRPELVWAYEGAPHEQSRHATFDHREGNFAWLIRKGEVTLRLGERTWRARAGQWLLLPPAITRQDFSDDARLLSVRFLCQWPDGGNVFARAAGGRATDDAAVLEARDHPQLGRAGGRLARLVRRHFGTPHNLHVYQKADYPLFLRFQRAFLEWLEAWFCARLAAGAAPARTGGTGDGGMAGGDERALRAARLLNDTPLDEGFPGAALLAAMGLGAVQANRVFRKTFGVTPRRQWERRRFESAKLWLETSAMPLKEMGARLGFRSGAHFVVWFRARARLTPGRWRARRRRI
ncbi:MAG: helix-turn-helix transcriptional regulator [Opitutaceae bacterium]|nr:helix-turn-helix transcriptional regulator [Opitutaceae bacterium]